MEKTVIIKKKINKEKKCLNNKLRDNSKNYRPKNEVIDISFSPRFIKLRNPRRLRILSPSNMQERPSISKHIRIRSPTNIKVPKEKQNKRIKTLITKQITNNITSSKRKHTKSQTKCITLRRIIKVINNESIESIKKMIFLV